MRDWALIEPYLRENEALFDIPVDRLLSFDGKRRAPTGSTARCTCRPSPSRPRPKGAILNALPPVPAGLWLFTSTRRSTRPSSPQGLGILWFDQAIVDVRRSRTGATETWTAVRSWITGTLNVPSVTVTVTFPTPSTIRKAVKLNVPARWLELTCVNVTLPDSDKLPVLFLATVPTPSTGGNVQLIDPRGRVVIHLDVDHVLIRPLGHDALDLHRTSRSPFPGLRQAVGRRAVEIEGEVPGDRADRAVVRGVACRLAGPRWMRGTCLQEVRSVIGLRTKARSESPPERLRRPGCHDPDPGAPTRSGEDGAEYCRDAEDDEDAGERRHPGRAIDQPSTTSPTSDAARPWTTARPSVQPLRTM